MATCRARSTSRTRTWITSADWSGCSIAAISIAALKGKIRIYAHAALITHLQARVADYPNVIAEGGANFWDAFVLVPCSRGFWHDGFWFDVFPTRHHAPMTSFGIALRGAFAWTGDTRPVPEMLSHFAPAPALIAHDCALHGNPSHSGIDDIEREYADDVRSRLVLYHYGSAKDGDALAAPRLSRRARGRHASSCRDVAPSMRAPA